MDNTKDFYVTIRVDGRYHIKVESDSIENAIEKAETMFQESDLGELEVVNSYANIVEDSNGDIIWDKA